MKGKREAFDLMAQNGAPEEWKEQDGWRQSLFEWLELLAVVLVIIVTPVSYTHLTLPTICSV